MSTAPTTMRTVITTVLVVEHAAAISDGLQALLDDDVQLVTADGVRTALSWARERPPHAVLIDLDLPDEDGGDVARSIRAMPSLHDVLVVFVGGPPGADPPNVEEPHDALPGAVDGSALLARLHLGIQKQRIHRWLDGHGLALDEVLMPAVDQAAAGPGTRLAPDASLGQLMAGLPGLAFVADHRGHVVAFSPALELVLAHPADHTAAGDRFGAELAAMLRSAGRRGLEHGTTATQPAIEVNGSSPLRLEVATCPLHGRDDTAIGVLGSVRDVTGLDRRRWARVTADLVRAQQIARVGSWRMELTEGEIHWSEQTHRLFGVPLGTPVTNELFLERVHPDDRDRVVAAWEAGQRHGSYALDHRIVVDGRTTWVHAQGEFELADGVPVRAVGTVLDIAQRKAYEQRLEAEQARLRDAFDAADAGSWEWHLPTDELRIGDEWHELLDPAVLSQGSLTVKRWATSLHPEDVPAVRRAVTDLLAGSIERYTAEFRLRGPDDRWFWIRALGRVTERDEDGTPTVVRGLMIDVTAQKEQQEQIDWTASHDGLTGLYNRARFAGALRDELTAAQAEDRRLALVCLDLDDFDAVNHAYGRAGGNQLLGDIAARLLGMVDDRSRLARIGGDEFALLITDDDASTSEWSTQVDEIHETLATPVRLRGSELVPTASIGVTVFPQPRDVDAEQLLRQADQAVYQAKLAGKNRTHVFDVEHDEHDRERYQRIDEVRRGLADDQFVLHYQPQVDLRTGELIGVEALIRWQHPQRGLLPPAAFIPLLDGHPLSVDVGDWVITEALDQLARWQADGLSTAISVNVDALQLHDPDFLDRLRDQLFAHPTIEPERLTLEILETGAMQDIDRVARLIPQIQELGPVVALDDFGTGYSSLTFLKQLAADIVKIDRSFVIDLLTDPDHAAIVRAIVGLADSFHRRVLAEGIESDEHGRVLLELGCYLGQGFGIAHPLPPAALADWAANWTRPAAWARATP